MPVVFSLFNGVSAPGTQGDPELPSPPLLVEVPLDGGCTKYVPPQKPISKNDTKEEIGPSLNGSHDLCERILWFVTMGGVRSTSWFAPDKGFLSPTGVYEGNVFPSSHVDAQDVTLYSKEVCVLGVVSGHGPQFKT